MPHNHEAVVVATAVGPAYRVHPAAEIFPMMSEPELRELGNDIAKHGLHVNLHGWRDNSGVEWLIDGRNRLAAMQLVGYTPPFWPITVSSADQGVDPYDLVLSLNIDRRHLSARQRRDLVAAVVRARPDRSNRQTAAATGVSHHTVAKVRAELEGRGQIAHVSATVDTKGRRQSTTKAKKATVDPDDRRHVDSRTMRAVDDFLERLDAIGAWERRFAWEVDAAHEAADTEWIKRAEKLCRELHDRLARISAVVDDEDYRELRARSDDRIPRERAAVDRLLRTGYAPTEAERRRDVLHCAGLTTS